MTDNKNKQNTDDKVKKKLVQLQSSPYYGTLLVYCVLENIKNNDGELTENAVVDIVRGMAKKHEGFRYPAKYSGMFRLVKDETVRKVIGWLKDCGVIQRCLVCGYYNDYYTLQIQDRLLSDKILESFTISEFPAQKLGKEPLSDPEVMILLQNEDMIKKAGLPAYIEILDHPYVFCAERDRICSLFKEAPESAKDYVKSAANEKDAMKRKMVSTIKKCL